MRKSLVPGIFCLLLDNWWYVDGVVPAKGDARGWLRFRRGISSMLSQCVVDHFTRNQYCELGANEENSRSAIATMSMRFAFMIQTRLRNIAHMEFQWPYDETEGLPVQRNIKDESIKNIAFDILSMKEDTDDSVGDAKPKAITKRKPKRKNAITKRKSKRKNDIIYGNKSSFKLPFYPILSKKDIAEADELRNIDNNHFEPSNCWKKIPTHECYSGGPSFELLKNGGGAIKQRVELLEDDYEKRGIDVKKKGTRGTFCISYQSLKTLKNHQWVNDEIINGFSAYFNKRQALKYTSHKGSYTPAHMFSSHFIAKLCFENNKRKFQVNVNDRWMNKTRMPICEHPEKAHSVEGAMDIFKCDNLIFPMNKGNQHWVFFSINPSSLRQELFDSLHGKINEERLYVSECLYVWILREHSIRHGTGHPKENERWSKNCVQSDAYVLRNSSQGSTVDCALHTIVVPVLMQDKLHLGVFGENHEEQVQAGIEMRRRMVLTFHRGEFMFETRPASQKEKNGRLVEQ